MISRASTAFAAFAFFAAVLGGPAAYGAEEGAGEGSDDASTVHFHGYHETHANIVLDGDRILDPHRTVLGLEAALSEAILFSFELDFEHAFEEPELEFAEVVGRLTDRWSLVGGTMLMPFGGLNETHEPPFFYSVERPSFQRDFIPTTWQEPGAGFRAGLADGALNLRGYLVSGLSAFDTADGGLRLKQSLREMKQKAKFAEFRDLAGVLRIEWMPTLKIKLGASFYGGGADQRREDSLQVQVGLAEADVKARIGNLEVRLDGGLGGFAGEYFDRRGVDGPILAGADAELAWHQALPWGRDQEAVPFARVEYIDPDAAGDAHTAYLSYVAGLAWYPIPQLALKADFTRFTHRNPRAYDLEGGRAGEMNQINLGIGLIYP